MANAKKVDLYNPNDGLLGRDGGPYLDQVEAAQAEIRRAAVEGREPDLENPGPYSGIHLVTAGQLVHDVSTLNVPSRDGTGVQDEAAQALANSEHVLSSAVASVEDINGASNEDVVKAEKEVSATGTSARATKKTAAKKATSPQALSSSEAAKKTVKK
jgi:hypothetical protein